MKFFDSNRGSTYFLENVLNYSSEYERLVASDMACALSGKNYFVNPSSDKCKINNQL